MEGTFVIVARADNPAFTDLYLQFDVVDNAYRWTRLLDNALKLTEVTGMTQLMRFQRQLPDRQRLVREAFPGVTSSGKIKLVKVVFETIPRDATSQLKRSLKETP